MNGSVGLIGGAGETKLGAAAPVMVRPLLRESAVAFDEAAPARNGAPQHPAVARKLDLAVVSDLAACADAWRAFQETADRTPFQTFDWLDQWQRHIGARRGTVPAIVFGRLDGELAFILPLAVDRRRGIRRLIWLGAERCDYNAPLLAPSFSDLALDWSAVWRDAVAAIRRSSAPRFDLIDLTKMPEWVGPQPNPMLVLPTVRNANDAHVATLGADWDSFYREKRSSSSRKVQRKQLNRLAEHGAVQLVRPREPGEAHRTVATLIEQKRRALQKMGADDMFEIPGVSAFYDAVATEQRLAALVDLSRLDVGEEIGAASVGLIDRGRYYLILSSYNDGEIARHGPGRAQLLELLRTATEMGLKAFDFTIGNEPYKLDWCDIRVPLFDHLSAGSVRGVAVRPAIAAFRALRRSIRNNAKAWEILSSFRERLAGARHRGEGAGEARPEAEDE